MVANSRFQNLFGKNGSLENQTKFEPLAHDPTEIVVTSGTTSDPLTGTTATNGEIVAEAHADALRELQIILAGGVVDASELSNFAKWVTIYGATSPTPGVEAAKTALQECTLGDLYDLAESLTIKLDFRNRYTIVSGVTHLWRDGNVLTSSGQELAVNAINNPTPPW